jgi:hypothetical protein
MSYTEDHLVEQPAIQLMQHELGWDVVNCYDEWVGGVSNQGRDGKREVEVEILNFECWILNGIGSRQAVPRRNPDLPVEAIEGAVEEMGILDDEFWILNGRGRRLAVPRLNLAETNREIERSGFPLAVGSLVFKQPL